MTSSFCNNFLISGRGTFQCGTSPFDFHFRCELLRIYFLSEPKNDSECDLHKDNDGFGSERCRKKHFVCSIKGILLLIGIRINISFSPFVTASNSKFCDPKT